MDSNPHDASPSELGTPARPLDAEPGDRLLNMIADVEQQLASLKQVHTQRRETELTLAEREADLAKREQDLVFRFDQIQAEKETLDAARGELERGRAEIQSGLAELESKREAQAERERMIREDTEQRIELLSQREEEIARGAELVRQSRDEIDRLRDELAAQQIAIDERAALFEAGEQELRAKLEGFRQRVLEAEQAREELQSVVCERETQLAALAEELREARVSSAGSAEAEARLSAADAEIAALRSELARLSSSLADREAMIAELREQQADAGVAGQRIQTLEAQLSAAVDAREALEERTRALESELETVQSEARAAIERARSEQGKRAGNAQRELEAARAACVELEAKLDAAQREKADLENDVLGLTAEIAQLRERGSVRSDTFTVSRRARLRAVRQALRAQSAKIQKANQALRKRYQQAEQVLAQRGELIVARDALMAAQSKVDTQGRAGRMFGAMALFLIVLTLVGSLSWVTALQVVPGRYAASAVIAAQSRNRDLTPDEGQQWVVFHQDALNDPRFLEMASERMRRRGITSMGSAPALRERMQADMDAFTSEPGTLTIELRGRGGQRTARELETLVASLIAHSNASRLRRADAAMTVLKTPPSGADRPIGYEHYAVAGSGLGVAVLLSGFLGFGIWRKLSSVKSTFEQQEQIDTALEEARWGLPEDLSNERVD